MEPFDDLIALLAELERLPRSDFGRKDFLIKELSPF